MLIHQNPVPETGAILLVLEKEQIRQVPLAQKQEWKIGRYYPDCGNFPDIPFSSAIVSRMHGSLHHVNGQWFYVDNPKNLNGTFHNGMKISRPMKGIKKPIPLTNGDILRIDNEDLDQVSSDGVLMLFTTVPLADSWAVYPLRKSVTVIGSDAVCDICEPMFGMSAIHSQIVSDNGNYILSDCETKEGTYLNGQKISTSVTLREKDHIMISGCNMFFLGNKMIHNSYGVKKRKWSRFFKL